MKKKNILLLFLVLSCFLVFSWKSASQAQSVVTLPDPLSGQGDDPAVLVGNILNYALGMLGVLALVMFVYGGLTWMTSGGASEKIKKGRDTILWSILGLALIFFSYALLDFVLTVLQQ
jgi:hypothetical protein